MAHQSVDRHLALADPWSALDSGVQRRALSIEKRLLSASAGILDFEAWFIDDGSRTDPLRGAAAHR